MVVEEMGNEADLAKAAPGEGPAVIRAAAAVIGKTVAEAQALAEAEGLLLETIPENDDERNYVLEMNRNPDRISAWTRDGVITSIIRIGNCTLA
jgi:hypothetical protein